MTSNSQNPSAEAKPVNVMVPEELSRMLELFRQLPDYKDRVQAMLAAISVFTGELLQTTAAVPATGAIFAALVATINRFAPKAEKAEILEQATLLCAEHVVRNADDPYRAGFLLLNAIKDVMVNLTEGIGDNMLQ